ncbi:Atxe2 family lasso peptide isopeptidase [Sphingomonas glacialis]|uniref:Atxe2 family lasso peptide isopeptidase n=1 Tax=Sphingomonas glacialis TaxID=658225 RepID=A0A502FS18_9SPHN|nr:Atxe2 family lasso peptide isopeptidase [Sphingomonas glacialis]TPG52234.1 Atxe2 family lasso peptide isopeptidase [Sphingomonas glacialis]
MVSRLMLVVAAAAIGWCTPARAGPLDCAARLMPPRSAARVALSARSLVELRDFGGHDNRASSAAPFALSPDGKWLALILRRADTETDGYCHGVMLLSRDGKRPPRFLDVGGDFVSMAGDTHGIPDMPNGAAAVVTPIWSPDSRLLLYLRRDHGVTQAWTVALGGGPAHPLTHLISDVREAAWTRDGYHVLVTSRPGVAEGERAIEQEGFRGFHYDARFWPLTETAPRPVLPIPMRVQTFDLRSGTVVDSPSPSAVQDLAGKPIGAYAFALSSGGARAWTIRTDPDRYTGPAALHVVAEGRELKCPEAICAERVAGLWWAGPMDIIFLRAGSAAEGGHQTLYRWRLDKEKAPQAVLDTADALFGCQWSAARLLCAAEQATRPRSIVEIDVRTGARRTVFDPNPDFPVAVGQVRRLQWAAGVGTASYGDLVLPPHHKAGERHPLIVVQYESRGFLRGGTGDEIPIFLLAARGYAVLSVQRTNWPATALQGRNFSEFQRANITNNADRRLLVSSLEAGVDAAIKLGVVDRERIGLTGMSDGATTVEYILSHRSRFRAVALSTCCGDPSTTMFATGIAFRDEQISSGFPAPGRACDPFWLEISIACNVAKIAAPILLHVSDREYRDSLETFSTLQVAGKAIDMYVFPDEYHVKWHPAHRLAEYQRVIAWFDFWLRDISRSDLSRSDEVARWEIMKQRLPTPS